MKLTPRVFAFDVRRVFRLADRTVIVGVTSHAAPPFLPPSKCEVLVDGVVIDRLRLDGEMIIERRVGGIERSVSTFDNLGVSDADIEAGRCALRCVPLSGVEFQ